MATTKIEWTEKTWNPVTGCTKISEACQNCYAEVMARRLQKMPASAEKYRNGFRVTLHPEALNEPYKCKKPSMVFVCSMGDLFHEDVPFDYIDKVIAVIRDNPQHTFQILTKRAERMWTYFEKHYKWIREDFHKAIGDIEDVPIAALNPLYPPSNVWLGVTCENSGHYKRVAFLKEIQCNNVKFLSCEPLLGDMANINLDGIDWVITGGESGTQARKTPVEWFRNLRDRCIETNTAFYFKQWGTWGEDGVKRSKKENGCTLDGKEWKQMPRVVTTEKAPLCPIQTFS